MHEHQDEDREHTEDTMIGNLIFDRYKLIKKLGAGSFGCIYSAEYENQYYAIKLEDKKKDSNLLENEAYIMSYLNGPGLPAVKSYGYSSRHNILVMELMGKSLEDIFETFVVKKMTVRCVCNIAYQMMEIMEYIHKRHIIHRDIKPDNFVIGRGEKKKYIYILDFGLAKKYRSSRTLEHYPVFKSKNLVGTARYASINALNGLTQSRRDDLEAIGYVLMYFLRGRLPWQGIPVKNKEERYRKIMEKKKEISAENLCAGFPEEFANYVNYTRNLQYEQDPDYSFLKNLFINVLKKEGHIIDCYYDWDTKTIKYFRDFQNFKNKNDDRNVNNENRDISNFKGSQYKNNNDIKVVNNSINNKMTPNNINTNNIQNNPKYPLNNNSNNANNITNQNPINQIATISALDHTNYEGSALKANETQINNNNNNNLNVQKNNYMENNQNIDTKNDNNDNNLEQNKKNKTQKDNCCCFIF